MKHKPYRIHKGHRVWTMPHEFIPQEGEPFCECGDRKETNKSHGEDLLNKDYSLGRADGLATKKPQCVTSPLCSHNLNGRDVSKPCSIQLPMNTQFTEEEEKLVKDMAYRFLGWKLPDNFNPDGGISFKRTFNENTPYPMKSEPSGTNLFGAEEAKKMVAYLLEGVLGPFLKAHDQRLLAHIREEMEKVDGKYKCAACGGAKCEHTLQCKSMSEVLAFLT